MPYASVLLMLPAYNTADVTNGISNYGLTCWKLVIIRNLKCILIGDICVHVVCRRVQSQHLTVKQTMK